MRRIITATVKDSSGVLNRVTGLLAKRGFNINSITVGGTETVGVSKMTFEVNITSSTQSEQVIKQLNKQITFNNTIDLLNYKLELFL